MRLLLLITALLATSSADAHLFRIRSNGRTSARPAAHTGGVRQAVATTLLSVPALASKLTGNRIPGDRIAAGLVRRLQPTPLVGPDRVVKQYATTIPAVSPAEAYDYFVQHPERLFAAEGLTPRPATPRLVDGARTILEKKGALPLWMPIEVHLDPAALEIRIGTLDGHLFRGVNTFRFRPRGADTRVSQRIEWQQSSPVAEIGMRLTRGGNEQDRSWHLVHDALLDGLRR